jgi:2-polyprenyl-3-methyl-5-hydroxy-6-metoxy-1,4-benzoquinol methylase
MAADSRDSEGSWSQEKVEVACDLCATDDADLLFEKETFRHVRCRHCGLVYVTPRLRHILERQKTTHDVAASYPGGFKEFVARVYSGHRKKSLRAEAAEYLPYQKTGHILDIGCGLGEFLRAASEQGWKHPEGIEIAPQTARYVRNHFPIQTRPLEKSHYEPGRFDVVRLNNVIEHLPSPKAVVRAAHHILRPGGLLTLSTPNFDSLSVAIWGGNWPYIGGTDHVYLFGHKTLTRLLEENGFRIIRLRTKGVHLTLKDHNGRAPRNSVSRLFDAVLLRVERALDLVIRLTLRGHRLKVWATPDHS